MIERRDAVGRDEHGRGRSVGAAAKRARFQAWAESIGSPTLAAWTPDGWTRDAANSLPTCPVWEHADERGVLRAFPQIGPPKSSWRGGAPVAHLAIGLGEDDSGAALDLDFAAEDWPRVLDFLPRWLAHQSATPLPHTNVAVRSREGFLPDSSRLLNIAWSGRTRGPPAAPQVSLQRGATGAKIGAR